MHVIIRILIPVVVIGGAIAVAVWLMANPPAVAKRRGPPAPQLHVDTLTIERVSYRVLVESFGFVQPRTQSELVAQVGGQITAVSTNFRDGGFFEAGERLLLIDPRDYEIGVKIAAAELVSQRQALVEERARVAQALRDWQRLGDGGEPPSLVSREPQLRAAEAAVAAAEGALDQARLALERTAIIAPYAGRIRSRSADIGQVVTAGTTVASIYATDAVEIALPIKNRDLAFIALPEGRSGEADDSLDVTIRSKLSPATSWPARLVRTEGAIDTDSRQLRVVARIDDPFASARSGGADMKIGEYVVAGIQGRELEDVIVIPNSSIYQGTYVYVVEDGLLVRREVVLAWRNASDAIVESGLEPGDRLVVTALGQVSSGTRVRPLKPAAARGGAAP